MRQWSRCTSGGASQLLLLCLEHDQVIDVAHSKLCWAIHSAYSIQEDQLDNEQICSWLISRSPISMAPERNLYCALATCRPFGRIDQTVSLAEQTNQEFLGIGAHRGWALKLVEDLMLTRKLPSSCITLARNSDSYVVEWIMRHLTG